MPDRSMPPHYDRDDAIRRIAKRLQDARENAGLEQADAGQATGIPTRTIRGWESGSVAQPAWGVAALSQVYGVAVEWLLAPDHAFHALFDPAAEREALSTGDRSRYKEASRVVSVLVSDRLRPMASVDEWHDRMTKIVDSGDRFRDSDG